MPEPSSLRQNGGTDTTEHATEESDSLGFTLNVDLSDCVGLPAHFRVWVRQNQTARSMRWLGDHVRRLANISGPFLMLADKYLLPPNETLRLLRSTDSIRLARVEHEWQRPFSYNDIDNSQVDWAHHFTRNEIQKAHEVHEAQPSSPIQNVTPVPRPSPQNSPLPPPALPNKSIKQTTIKMSPVSDLQTSVKSSTSTPDLQPSIDKNLQSVKRRALALLQHVAGEGQDQEGQDDVDAPRKRRRRVRRRRPTRPISPFVDSTDPRSVPMEPPASKSTVNLTSLPDIQSTPKISKVLPPPDSPDVHSETYTPSDTITAPSTSTDGYLKVISAYNDQRESYPTSSIAESPSECKTDRSRSPSPVSQNSRTPKLVSATTVALLTLESAPAPVVRNQASTRAPRVVRALSTGPVE